MFPYLVVPLISAKVPLISTIVLVHCQAILFNKDDISIYNYGSVECAFTMRGISLVLGLG